MTEDPNKNIDPIDPKASEADKKAKEEAEKASALEAEKAIKVEEERIEKEQKEADKKSVKKSKEMEAKNIAEARTIAKILKKKGRKFRLLVNPKQTARAQIYEDHKGRNIVVKKSGYLFSTDKEMDDTIDHFKDILGFIEVK